MNQITIRLGKELANQVSRAIEEFGYPTKASFVRAAIRNELKELGVERKKNYAWHKLLSAHKEAKKIGNTWTTREKPHRSRLTLKDLIRHQYNHGQTKLI